MRLSTLTQRTELRTAEERHDLAGHVAAIAVLAALVLAFGGQWLWALGALAAGGLVFAGTALEVHAAGDPRSTEAFYRLADPRTPLELSAASSPGGPGVATDSAAHDTPLTPG